MRHSIAVILCFLKVSGFGAPECYNIAFCFAQHFFLFTSVTDVCFINRKFPFCDAISICSYFHFEVSCITVIFPNVTLKNMSEQVQTQRKTKYWQVWCIYINTPIKEVLSLPLLQMLGGNPTFPKVKRSDWLQTSEIWIGCYTDWPRCRIEGQEVWGKNSKNNWKLGCENIRGWKLQ
jgi:hypothetical protein